MLGLSLRLSRKFDTRVYDSSLIDFLESQSNVSEFIRNVLDDFRIGKLSYNDNNADSIKEQLEQEKLKEKLNKNSLHNLTKREKLADVKIKEYHADNLGVIGSNPSLQAKNAMKHHVNGTIPYDEKAIHCPECTWKTNSKDSANYQINGITWHIKNFHKRNLTETEADEITRLLI